MSILRYFSKKDSEGSISNPEFDIAKSLMEEVQKNMDTSSLKSIPKKRGQYGTYTPKQRFDIGKFAAEHEHSKAVSEFSPIINRKLSY